MEEMIRRARKMDELMDYDSLSLFPNARLPPKLKMPTLGEIIQSSSGPRHLSTIPLKNSHLFKIAELTISFC